MVDSRRIERTRRTIYAGLALAIVLPLLFPVGLHPVVSADAQKLYDFIEDLKPGSIVWLGWDYYLATTAECGPNAEAILTHLFRRNLRVVITSEIPDSQAISQHVSRLIGTRLGKRYGVDYLVLGYQPGDKLFFKQAAASFHGTFSHDAFGTPLDQWPLAADLHSAKDVSLVMCVTDNQAFEYYVQVVHTTYHTPVAGAMTAVMVPGYQPYLNSGQALAILGGLRGAAEYEMLLNVKGRGSQGLDAQSFAHVYIALLIIVSNIVYLVQRRG